MSLVDDLKAAHEAATPGPWSGPLPLVRVGKRLRHQTFTGELRELPEADESLIVLTRNALPEIIAALEERERLREEIRVMSLYLRHNEWCAIYRNLHCTCGLDVQLAALDALEGRG